MLIYICKTNHSEEKKIIRKVNTLKLAYTQKQSNSFIFICQEEEYPTLEK